MYVSQEYFAVLSWFCAVITMHSSNIDIYIVKGEVPAAAGIGWDPRKGAGKGINMF